MPRYLLAVIVGLAVAFAVSFGLNFLLAYNGAEPLSSTWVMGGVLGTTTMAIMMNLSGNRKVAFADRAAREAALSLRPPAGQALILAYREGFMGKAIGMDIQLDRRLVTQIKSRQFCAMTVAPGQHVVTGILTGDANAGSVPADMVVTLAEGEAAAVRFTLKLKLSTSDVVATRIDNPAAIAGKLAGMRMVLTA